MSAGVDVHQGGPGRPSEAFASVEVRAKTAVVDVGVARAAVLKQFADSPRSTMPPLPRSARIELDSACNLRCPSCTQNLCGRSPPAMDPRVFRRIARDLHAFGVVDLGVFALTASVTCPRERKQRRAMADIIDRIDNVNRILTENLRAASRAEEREDRYFAALQFPMRILCAAHPRGTTQMGYGFRFVQSHHSRDARGGR